MDYHDYKKLHQSPVEYFWYKARHLLISNLLDLTLIKHNKERKIVEIGCGTGIQLPLLSKFGQTEGLDISPEGINIVKQSGFSGK
jgi:methylase of polypeptide subunit release factors